MTSGLYAFNNDIKYPLSDFHETDIPNSILSDLTLGIPAGLDAVVGCIRITGLVAFITIQNRTTGESIAIGAISNPVPGRVYPLEMDVDGYGWVVFGSGIYDELIYTGPVEIDLDPEVVTQLQVTAPKFAVEENGYTYDVTNVLNLLTVNDTITITVENGIIYVDRNDATLNESQIAGFTNILGEDLSELIYTIAGAVADDDGNIDIDIVGLVPACRDVWQLQVPRGNASIGTHTELPLDKFSPRLFTDGNSCVEADSSEFPDTSDDAQLIIKTDILDRTDDHPVGTLYYRDPNTNV
jgi:hypothetical protein